MPGKKHRNDALDEIDKLVKLLYDQALNHMKKKNYVKALNGYHQNIIRDILGPNKESELLQSFVRIGIENKEKDEGNRRSLYLPAQQSFMSSSSDRSRQRSKFRGKSVFEKLQRLSPRDWELFGEVYTDKARAAAVSAGSYDIKQSLKLKEEQEKYKTLLLQENTDPSSLITLCLKEVKFGNIENATVLASKAIELSPNDINALIARSKCYLMLGDASKALEDAETAINIEKLNIRAIYQKAEALYYKGEFEQSLMYFHQGLRARPELESFRLGIQKSQEAIENTIGFSAKNKSKINTKISKNRLKSIKSKDTAEKVKPKKINNELSIDKEYLESLLKHPDLKRADTGSENISTIAKEAINFLNKRQEFWHQQRPCTAILGRKLSSANQFPPE